jgi:hypothetical protein
MQNFLFNMRNLEKKDWTLAFIITACFVILTLFLGYYSNLVIPGNPDNNARYLMEPSTHLDFMSEWDGPHYLNIAQKGYTDNALTAFFPLYPLLIHLIMYVLLSPIISALVISWLCLAGALFFYIKILKTMSFTQLPDIVMGVLLFLFFPTGVFLAATYTESLFALAALGALYFALKGKYLWAGLFAALATATHPNGIFIIPLIMILLWETKQKIWQIITSAIIGSLGIIGYMSYLWASKGNPISFVSAQKSSHWLSNHYVSTIINSFTPIDFFVFILAISSVIYWWSRKKSFAIYSLLYVLLPLIGGNFSGYSRYALMTFPIQFMLLKKFHASRLAYSVILLISGVFWAYFVIHYAAGYTGGS